MKYLVIGSEGPGFASPEQAVEILEKVIRRNGVSSKKSRKDFREYHRSIMPLLRKSRSAPTPKW
jgi:hypothetical protein